MKYFFLTICFMLLTAGVFAQERLFRAYLKASDDFEPLNEVLVRDLRSGKVVRSDADGYFEIKTFAGHILELSQMNVKTQRIEISPTMFDAVQQITLRNKVNELSEVVVVEKTRYQIDSLERYETYQQDLERKKDKVSVAEIAPGRTGFGIVLNNPISSWMQHVAPRSKKRIRFQKNFAAWEEQKYIEQKYTKERVATLTGLQNDSLAWFMNAYPMPYDMARTSSQEQIDIWIKANFDSWKHNAGTMIRRMEIKE